MASFLIKGGRPLNGKVRIAGSKNSVLALIPAALIGDTPTILKNVPRIRDVEVMIEIIRKLGVRVDELSDNILKIDPSGLTSYELDPELTGRIRGSVILAAPLLVRFGKAVITPPGGDQIGQRFIGTHISMMKRFGIDIKKEGKKYFLNWKSKKSLNIFLEEASVTATEIGLILASSLPFKMRIGDAAAEPHIQDLASLLGKMGADIKGAGTNNISILGKKHMRGVEHKVVSDYIEGGTFAIASAITGGSLEIENCNPSHYEMINIYLKNMGVDIGFKGKKLIVKPSKLIAKKKKFQTRTWPGFPTDLMSPFIVLATQTEGTVLCHDWMYEWRIFFADDLISMGANVFIADPHRVIINGPTKLHGEVLYSKDIRAGIAMVLAALAAEGESQIRNIEMIERGYEMIDKRLVDLGADIERVE